MVSVQYVTTEGWEKLKQELAYLKTTARREAANRIETAKALGDLSENAEYHEAKEAHAFLEGRILEIEEILKNAVLIEGQKNGAQGTVQVGASVVVEVGGKEKIFIIVGSNEADPLSGKISNESPTGSALLGRSVGDVAEVQTPGGMVSYKIKEIK